MGRAGQGGRAGPHHGQGPKRRQVEFKVANRTKTSRGRAASRHLAYNILVMRLHRHAQTTVEFLGCCTPKAIGNTHRAFASASYSASHPIVPLSIYILIFHCPISDPISYCDETSALDSRPVRSHCCHKDGAGASRCSPRLITCIACHTSLGLAVACRELVRAPGSGLRAPGSMRAARSSGLPSQLILIIVMAHQLTTR